MLNKRRVLILCLAFVTTLSSSYFASAQDLVTNTPTVEAEAIATAIPNGDSISGTIVVDIPIDDTEKINGDGFEIIAMRITRTAHVLQAVTLTIQNISDEELTGISWYLLTPSYITEEPWRFAEYIAPVELLNILAPGEIKEITFTGPDDTLAGEYTLSTWVHRVNANGTTTHADGAGYNVPIIIGPPLFVTVDHVDVFPAPDDQSYVFVTMTLRNYSPQFVEVAYSYSLAEPSIEKPWEDGLFSLPYHSLILLPGEDLVITTRDILPVPEGEFEVIGYLQENTNGEYSFQNNDVYFNLITRAES